MLMRPLILLSSVLVFDTSFGQTAPPKDLPIRAISLYRSGVGSFERGGTIEGSATIQLRFNTDQVNDILKSMMVLDLSGRGRIDSVAYASRDPLVKRLASFGVDISDEPSLGALLSRLRGSTVSISMAEGVRTGIVLGGEVRQESSPGRGPAVNVAYVNLLGADGIRSLNLSHALGVEIKDKELGAELNRALAALAEYRAERTKTVEIAASGEGSREIVVAYVNEAPVWKATYRLMLSKAEQGTGDRLNLQGWAIVENTTDEDWNNVKLSLVSGRPIEFQMDLYQPLYLPRPLVDVPVVAGAAPRVFDAGTKPGAAPAEPFGANEAEKRLDRDESRAGAPEFDHKAAFAGRAAEFGAAYKRRASAAELVNSAPQAQAQGVEAGEVFEFQLDHPVSVERQRSAMLPIIAQDIQGQRVSIYARGDGSRYPMRGVRVTNSTTLQLLPGPVSVMDEGVYAGDAQVGHIPPGDSRFLAYSMDLSMTVDATDTGESRVSRVRIVKGMLEATYQRSRTVEYTAVNRDSERGRTLIVEHVRTPSWELKAPAKPMEVTDTLYRFSVAIEKATTKKLSVVETTSDVETIALGALDNAARVRLEQTGAAFSPTVLDSMKEAQRQYQLVEDARKRAEALEKERAAIDSDQARIRQNIVSIERASDLYRTYIQKLTTQEARLEALAGEIRDTAGELMRLNRALADYLANLNVN